MCLTSDEIATFDNSPSIPSKRSVSKYLIGSSYNAICKDMALHGDSIALLRASIDRAGNFQSWRHGADCSPAWHPVSRDGLRLRSGFPGATPEGPPLPLVAQGLPTPSTSEVAAVGAYKLPRTESASGDPSREDLEARITEWASAEAPHAAAGDIAFMLWSLSAVESKNLVLVDALIVRANAQAHEFSPTELAMAVKAIAELNVRPSTLAVRDVLLRVEDAADKFSRNAAEDVLRSLRTSGLSRQDTSLPARRAVAALEQRCNTTAASRPTGVRAGQ